MRFVERYSNEHFRDLAVWMLGVEVWEVFLWNYGCKSLWLIVRSIYLGARAQWNHLTGEASKVVSFSFAKRRIRLTFEVRLPSC